MVVDFSTSCTIGGWYYGGINIRGASVNHPNDPTCGLKGGPLGRCPPDELPPSESLGCPPFGGWWAEPLGT